VHLIKRHVEHLSKWRVFISPNGKHSQVKCLDGSSERVKLETLGVREFNMGAKSKFLKKYVRAGPMIIQFRVEATTGIVDCGISNSNRHRRWLLRSVNQRRE
jgi:hypothetical protein